MSKCLLLLLVLGLTYSCVEPEEVPVGDCDPTKQVCEKSAGDDLGGGDDSSDNSGSNDTVDVSGDNTPGQPQFSCTGNSIPYGRICSPTETAGLTANVDYHLVAACSPEDDGVNANKCEYECIAGYEADVANQTCSPVVNNDPTPDPTVEYTCSGSSFDFATLCAGDDTGLMSQQNFSLVASCSVAGDATKKCEFVCLDGYEPNQTMSGCQKIVADTSGGTGGTPGSGGNDDSGPTIASKNYLQINNTFSTLTGVATDHPEVLSEFQAIIMQLPTTSDPEALNGFNQIAQTRLGFAYCSVYIDDNFANYSALSNDAAAVLLLDSFVDVDHTNSDPNHPHRQLKAELINILSDADVLVNDNNATNKKRKLVKMACGALLASAYVTMI